MNARLLACSKVRSAAHLTVVACAVVSTACAAWADETVVYSQPPQWERPIYFYPSGTGEGNPQVADNFMLTEASAVTTLRWWGSWAPITTFVVRFLGDDGTGVPGDVLYEWPDLTPSIIMVEPHVSKQLGADLPETVFLEANTRYYLSIVGYPAEGYGWSWQQAVPEFGGEGFRRYGDGGAWARTIHVSDCAFDLIVPEPASSSLLGLPSLMLLLRRRSRRAS